MPRLIVLLVTLASLTIVTVQNLGAEKAVSLVVLGRPLSSIPLGLLLLGAVGTGALTTLILYGIVGLRRATESATKSKYKPMGSRVPYPESGSTVPPAGSTTSSSYGSTGSTAGSTAYGSGGSAFVTEPPVDQAGTAPTSTDSMPSSSSSADTTPATPSNVYSPFSRNQDVDSSKAGAKKKGPTAE